MSAASQTEEQRLILRTVRDFVDREVIPVASAMEHRGEYPHALPDEMAKLGLFGLNIPEEYGGTEVDYVTFARILWSFRADGSASRASSARTWCFAT